MKPENMIGKLVEITNTKSGYYKHWGFIREWDGSSYHVNGGSISSDFGEITPVFDRDEFKLPRSVNTYIRSGLVEVEINATEEECDMGDRECPTCVKISLVEIGLIKWKCLNPECGEEFDSDFLDEGEE